MKNVKAVKGYDHNGPVFVLADGKEIAADEAAYLDNRVINGEIKAAYITPLVS